jgi:ABC-type thiamine transport system ATPase subunit
VIELLGIGVPRRADGWILRRVSARFGPELTVVVSSVPDERNAFLDTIAGVRVPTEGRAWIEGIPVMVATKRLLGRRVADVRPSYGDPPAPRVDRLARDIARTVRRRPEVLILRDLDVSVGEHEMQSALAVVDVVRRSQRVAVILSMADIERARRHAERLIVLAGGGVAFDGAPGDLEKTRPADGRRDVVPSRA